MFKKIRIAILLLILVTVIFNYYHDQNQNWEKPIYVAVYPINASDSYEVKRYIDGLTDKDFAEISEYLSKESQKYGFNTRIYYRMGKEVKQMPPSVPENPNMLSVALWSLKFRYYAYKNASDIGVPTDLGLFLNYYDAKQTQIVQDTSTALENGRIGVVNLFGKTELQDKNNVVLTHESLHGFGATDKYNLMTKQPIEPFGLGNPSQDPLYPQTQAELMAVHKAISQTENEMAKNLGETVIGRVTAAEIGWHH